MHEIAKKDHLCVATGLAWRHVTPAAVGRGGRMMSRCAAVGYGSRMASMVGHAAVGYGGRMTWRHATVSCGGGMTWQHASSVCRHVKWRHVPPCSTMTMPGNVSPHRMVAGPAARANGGMCHVLPGRPIAMEMWSFLAISFTCGPS
jgi:hypothetical protein